MNLEQDLLKQRVQAITRLVVAALVAINLFLQAKGLPCIEIGEGDVATTINVILTILTSVYGLWWKNNNMTPAGVAGQQVTNAFKDGTIDDVVIEEYEEDEEDEEDA